MIPDYYSRLGVSTDATPAQIKTAYRRLVRQHHPDVNGGQDEKIKGLNEAYAVLNDEKKRAAYDELRRRERQRIEAARRSREEPKMTWMQGMIGFVRELKKEMRDD